MSILNRLRLTAHLDDAGLAALWTDEATGGVRQAHPHLESCAACRARFAELSSWLENAPRRRDDRSRRAFFRRAAGVTARTDFPSPRSRRAAGACDRVPTFRAAVDVENLACIPLDCRRCRGGTHRRRRRWPADGSAPSVYAAGRERRRLASPNCRGDRGRPAVQSMSDTRDEAFLSELDASLSRAAVPELRALDAFTPRAGDRSR